MNPTLIRWLADENFPVTSYKILVQAGLDIIHVADAAPSVNDADVIGLANQENRISLTFDSDFGTLIFRHGYRPPGVVYYRLPDAGPDEPAYILLQLLTTDLIFAGFMTVIAQDSIRQKAID